MAGFLDDQAIDIPCPSCRHKTSKSVRWIKSNRRFKCRCGEEIELSSEQFRREIAKAEAAYNKFKRALDNFGR